MAASNSAVFNNAILRAHLTSLKFLAIKFFSRYLVPVTGRCKCSHSIRPKMYNANIVPCCVGCNYILPRFCFSFHRWMWMEVDLAGVKRASMNLMSMIFTFPNSGSMGGRVGPQGSSRESLPGYRIRFKLRPYSRRSPRQRRPLSPLALVINF